MNRTTGSGLVVFFALACTTAARAQNTFFVDFGGLDNTPQGTITPLSISGLTGMTGGAGNDLTTLESLIVSKLQTMYAGTTSTSRPRSPRARSTGSR